MKRIYIAGPMSGLPELNFPAFHAAAASLRGQGHHVENPAEINADPKAQWLDCMRMDIARLVTCDAVHMLPGWEKSRGAKVEHGLAVGLGLAVTYAGGDDGERSPRAVLSKVRSEFEPELVHLICGLRRYQVERAVMLLLDYIDIAAAVAVEEGRNG